MRPIFCEGSHEKGLGTACQIFSNLWYFMLFLNVNAYSGEMPVTSKRHKQVLIA